MKRSRIEIAEELLGCRLDDGEFAPCPGEDLHTGKNARRDFRVLLDGAPTAYCVHASCLNVVADFNKRLRRAIWQVEEGANYEPRASLGPQVAAPPKSEPRARPEIDRYMIWETTRGVPKIDEGWLRRRSPVDIERMTAGQFLDALFAPEEKVLIFTSQMSQGDFCWWQGAGYRLAQERTVKARPSALPAGSEEGVWFLVQPVSGKWEVNPRVKLTPPDAEKGEGWKREVRGMWTRRSQQNVTDWRHFVLESDVIETSVWLQVLAALAFPIVAIYTSGGRSIHALVKWPVSGKAEWDAIRNMLRQIVCPLGADPAALSAVRLSRLPGCRRGTRPQRLLYLNPNAEAKRPIVTLPEVRA